MGVVARRVCVPVLVLLVLALGGAQAHAATYDFSISPYPPNEDQATTFSIFPASTTGVTVTWDLDGTAGFEASGRTVTHVYRTPGPAKVRMRVLDSEGRQSTVTKTFTVNAAPLADFGFTPGTPLTGQGIAFSSAVTDPEGEGVTLEWQYGDGTGGGGPAPTHSYAAPGTYSVTLTATDVHGATAFVTRAVTVRDPAPLGATPPVRRLVQMRPFPIVRIAGIVLSDGARIQILSVRAPRGSQVRVRCRGRSCPAGSVARTSATRVVRFHRFERKLAAGVRLELFVRQTGKIGKYTRFLIRAGKPPARVDRCLIPGRRRPVLCS